MDTTKFKILEVIIKNRKAGFNAMQVALLKAFPEMSWEVIKDFISLLRTEGYLATLYADNDLYDVALRNGALARLYDVREETNNNSVKQIISNVIALFKISI